MSRPVEITLWAGLVLASLGVGVAIAGIPEIGGASDDAAPVVTTTTTTTTAPPTTTEMSDPVTTTEPEPEPEPTTTTEPEPEIRPVSEVTVLVANSTDVTGAAGRITVSLTAEGYPTLTPATVSGFDRSEIWFVEGYGAEATRLAERLEIFPEDVGPIPGDPGFAVGGADLVVILGPGLAENA